MEGGRSRAGASGPVEVLGVALRLGLTSFGGPIAHLGYFRREYVERRRWLDEGRFADLVALCQLLPGATSSELGIAIGTIRAGYAGGIAAWTGFTLPSAIALTAFALLTRGPDMSGAGWVEGLKLAAVAVVAQAVVAMARALFPEISRAALAVAVAALILAAPGPLTQMVAIAGGGLFGWLFFRVTEVTSARPDVAGIRRRAGLVFISVFALLLVGLPLAQRMIPSQVIAEFDAFYRPGALVFGGGHVVLPLLQTSVVTPGWISEDRFLAGYGAAQAVPGPLFTVSAYLGASLDPEPNGMLGAAIALVAMFLPSFLLVWGALPFWDRLRGSASFAGALRGTNAAVVGILGAALITPIGTSSLHTPIEAIVAAIGFVALLSGRLAPLVVVGLLALVAELAGMM